MSEKRVSFTTIQFTIAPEFSPCTNTPQIHSDVQQLFFSLVFSASHVFPSLKFIKIKVEKEKYIYS